jgi:small conductance mechanosensitive channel
LESLKAWLRTQGVDTALNILSAAVILLLGFLVAKLCSKWLNSVLDRSRIKDDALTRKFFLRVLSASIIVMAGLTAMNKLGWDVQSFVAGLGITGIIVGFAFKDTLSNFAAGLLLLVYRPFRAGEMIEVEGVQGIVDELTIVNMQMTTTDGVRVIMPNSKVWGARITNFSRSRRRRLELKLKVHQYDSSTAIGAIKDALDADSRVLKDPPPQVRVTGLENDCAWLSVWLWVDPQDHAVVSAEQYLVVQAALQRAEIAVQ